MRTRYLLFLLAIPVFAQDVPTMRQYQCSDAVAEIGVLHLEVKQRDEYIATLQAKIKELQEKK